MAELWKVSFEFQQVLSGDLPEKLSSALEDLAAAVLLHNKESTDGDNWSLTLTTVKKPDVKEILRRVEEVAANENLSALITEKDIRVERIPDQDWLEQVHKNFPPIVVGSFFVYGSHYKALPPTNIIPLQIDAATAFGSGEHETTRGCLLALERLRGNKVKRGLDMGCGSGILAIALTKLWPDIDVTAIDIDPESVRVTQLHAGMNASKMHAESGDGYKVEAVGKNAPYDIITANILAGPLIDMAPQLAAVLAPDGHAVLSGLLRRQKEDVVRAHEKEGLKLVHAEEIGDWQALVLKK